MSFLDNLSSLIKIDVSSLKNIILKINIGSNNKKIINNGKIVVVNVNKFDNKGQELIKEILRGEVEEGKLLLEEDSSKLIEEVKAIESKGDNKSILKFFEGKIPASDQEILRASFIIKEIYEMHSPVSNLRDDILQRYGKRGINISNLCTAGYFSTLIKPLYEEMSRLPNFSIDKFRERYNVIVEQYTFAVFVSNRMLPAETKQKILEKIELNKKYGIRQLNIHGIGKSNVIKIQEVLYEIRTNINWPAEIDSGNSFINVKITF